MIDVTNNDAINDELLPCPFCGGTPVWYCKGNVDYLMRKRTIIIKCPNCGTRQETSVYRLPTRFGAMQAMTKWNLRMGGK